MSAIWTTCLVATRRARPLFGVRMDYRIAPPQFGVCGRSRHEAQRREMHSPSRKNIVPNLASQMRTAFSSIAWNTGSSSPGELADDLQYLGGRGLLLQRYSRSSLSRRVFSMAMTAWSANALISSICFSVNGPWFVTCGYNCANHLVSPHHGGGNDRIILEVTRNLLGCHRYKRIANHRRVLHDLF